MSTESTVPNSEVTNALLVYPRFPVTMAFPRTLWFVGVRGSNRALFWRLRSRQ